MCNTPSSVESWRADCIGGPAWLVWILADSIHMAPEQILKVLFGIHMRRQDERKDKGRRTNLLKPSGFMRQETGLPDRLCMLPKQGSSSGLYSAHKHGLSNQTQHDAHPQRDHCCCHPDQ